MIIQSKCMHAKKKRLLRKAFFLCVFVLYGQADAYSIQMLEFLPQNVKDSLKHLNMSLVYELRLRADKPTTVNYAGQYLYLGAGGLTERSENAICCDLKEVSDCIFRAGKYSVYAVEEQIKRGYLTAANGERIGIAGEYVFEKGQPLAFRNVTSLCIRVPHEIIGCASELYQICMQNGLRSVLLLSPPGLGKTTILRDLARIIGNLTKKNVLICDERGEISAGNVGESADVLKFADKATAFEAGIRAMRPDIIITDELSEQDCVAIKRAALAGIKVMASAHFSGMGRLKEPFFGTFERYVVLDEMHIGRIKGVYDEKGREII